MGIQLLTLIQNESFFEHNREEFMKKTKPIMDQAQEWLHRGERKVQEGIEKLGLDEPMKPTSSDKFIRHTESEVSVFLTMWCLRI